MTDTSEERSVFVGVINREGEDALHVVMRACLPDSEPAAEVIFTVRPDAPNSYPEWETLMCLFTEQGAAMMHEALNRGIERAVAEATPEDIERAAAATFDTLRLSGWSLEDAGDAAQGVMDLGGGA
jgi:hypothetical protein